MATLPDRPFSENSVVIPASRLEESRRTRIQQVHGLRQRLNEGLRPDIAAHHQVTLPDLQPIRPSFRRRHARSFFDINIQARYTLAGIVAFVGVTEAILTGYINRDQMQKEVAAIAATLKGPTLLQKEAFRACQAGKAVREGIIRDDTPEMRAAGAANLRADAYDSAERIDRLPSLTLVSSISLPDSPYAAICSINESPISDPLKTGFIVDRAIQPTR